MLAACNEMLGGTVKICGLKTMEALAAVIAGGADMAGFVFFGKSPRHLSLQQARMLGARAAGNITKVALVVDAADAAIAEIIAALQPEFLQLHGHETPERIAEIRTAFGRPVIKAFGIAAEADLAAALAQAGPADWLLFDAKPPVGASHPGGNGIAFDWTFLARAQISRPWMLSGGLDPVNVARAIALSGAAAVDVSSGVESAPGIKEAARIAAFIAAAKG